MIEPGSDELLRARRHEEDIAEPVLEDDDRRAVEEQRVVDAEPADDEPGEPHPDPDQTPAGEAPEYDPTPPEAPNALAG